MSIVVKSTNFFRTNIVGALTCKTGAVKQSKKRPDIKFPFQSSKQKSPSLETSEVKVCKTQADKLTVGDKVTSCLHNILEAKEQGKKAQDELHLLNEELTAPPANTKALKPQKTLKLAPAAHDARKTPLDEATLKVKLQGVQMDPKLAEKYPEDLSFLFKTRLIYSIAGYQNSTCAGKIEHELKESTDPAGAPGLLIKKQGQWVSVKEIQETLQWDAKESMLASKSNSHERWNYFGNGLVPVDRFYHHEEDEEGKNPDYPRQNSALHPVAKLSEEEMQKALAQALKFSGYNLEKNPANEKAPLDCIVQFVSHPRPLLKSPIGKNFNAQVPVHCGIRLILSDGTVYSTGFGSTLKEDEWSNGLRSYLATINGQPTILDYEEFRQHEGRIVTSVPLNSERASIILAHLNSYRKNTIRFNILKQNCMRLGTHVLAMSGVHLNINVSLEQMLFRALPNAADIPGVGKWLDCSLKLKRKVTKAVSQATPQCVKQAFKALACLALYVPYKFMTLSKNILAYSLGARIASPRRNQACLEKFPKEFDDDELERFSALLENLFDDKASDIQHSSIFINWQLTQNSTIVHRYAGSPSMNLLPPESDEDLQYAEKKAQELKAMFKYSLPKNSSASDTHFSFTPASG